MIGFALARKAGLRRAARRGPWGAIALALALWTGRAAAQPPSLFLHSAVYVPARQSMFLFGGTPDTQIYENQTWQLTLDLDPRWRQVLTVGTPPAGRLGQSAVYDPVRDRLLVFGGIDGNAQILGDVWALSLSDSTWTLLQPTGNPPTARRYHTAIYDAARDRMIVFGGDAGFGLSLNDVWSLWLDPAPRWERIFPHGSLPFARRTHSAIYDAPRDRIVVFGSNLPSNDVWALSFADTTWRLMSPSGTPPAARFGHSAIYDAAGDRMVVFGGFDNNQYLDDVWSLPLADPSAPWAKMAPSPPAPSARGYHSAVYDAAHARMVAFGGQNVTDPTWALSLTPPEQWSPEAPSLTVAPQTLSLPTTTVGDTVSIPFSVVNRGLQPLQISGFQLSSPELRVSSPGPLPLTWNAGVNETLSLAATTAGVRNDSLVVVSNDPLVPRRQIALHLDVRPLDFTTRVLGSPDSVPPGVAFVVVVTPSSGVHIEDGKLFYRIQGTTSLYDSLALAPLATDFIGTVPASAVTEHGVEYFVRVENSGFASFQPAQAPASWISQRVAAPGALPAVVPRPTSGSDFLVGEPIEVDVQLPPGAVFDSGTLSYRRAGDTGFEASPFLPASIAGQVAAVIPDSLVGPRGVEYHVTIKTLRATLDSPAPGPSYATISTLVSSLSEPFTHPGERYRLLSVPLDFGTGFSGSLDALLTDDLGSYDPLDWRAFLYDPATTSNVEFSGQQAERFRPAPGRTFWLISRHDHRVTTGPIAGFSTPSSVPYSLTLAPGWNLIGDPFDFPVSWSEVGGDTAFTGEPVAFDPSRGKNGDYSEVTPVVLAPFEGYFVHAAQAATLLIPNRAAPASVAAGPAHAQDLGGWRARVSARTTEAEDAANVIGFATGAEAGFDALDWPKPPVPPGSWVRAAFAHPEWSARSGDYRRDLRSPAGDGETWEVEVQSANRGEVVTLELTELARGAAAVRLLDREQGTSLEWKSAPGSRAPLAHEVVSFGNRPYHLAVVAGSEEYVRNADVRETPSVPERTQLDRVAPNPFYDATRIRFGLPRSGVVKLEIYGLQGERVASLLSGDRLEAGYHSAVWDGRKASGGLAASGVYVARLEVEGAALTTRLVLVR